MSINSVLEKIGIARGLQLHVRLSFITATIDTEKLLGCAVLIS